MLKPGPVGVGDVLNLGDVGDEPMRDNEMMERIIPMKPRPNDPT